MKKYGICLILLFFSVSTVCAGTGYLVRRSIKRERSQAAEEMLTETAKTEVFEEYPAISQRNVNSETISSELYYLVAEDGFLLVFSKDQETICLYTHIPLTDFPEGEQEHLREGIWFPSMDEVFQYLESYTS